MEALTTTAKFGATAQGVIKRIDELIRRRKLDANRKTVVVMATNQVQQSDKKKGWAQSLSFV